MRTERQRAQRRKRARFSEDVTARVIEALRAGATWRRAARAAGVGLSSVHEWLARGEGRHERPREGHLVAFARAARATRAEAVLGALRERVDLTTFELVLARLVAAPRLAQAA